MRNQGTFLLCVDMRVRRRAHGKSPSRDSEGRREPSQLRRKDFIGKSDPRGRAAARGLPISGPFRVIPKACGAIPGQLAFCLSTTDRRRGGAGLWIDRPGRAPFPGADSIFSSPCGAVSGRLAFGPSAAD